MMWLPRAMGIFDRKGRGPPWCWPFSGLERPGPKARDSFFGGSLNLGGIWTFARLKKGQKEVLTRVSF